MNFNVIPTDKFKKEAKKLILFNFPACFYPRPVGMKYNVAQPKALCRINKAFVFSDGFYVPLVLRQGY